jgi:hypothetical protein
MPNKITRQEVKPNPERVRFCFDYLQPDHPKFPLSSCSDKFLQALLREIVRYSNWTVDLFKDMNNVNHRHSTTFGETTEPEGFADIDPSDQELWTEEAWQFALPGERGTPSDAWRVHGFIMNNIFHVVWLDPDHKLCKKWEEDREYSN